MNAISNLKAELDELRKSTTSAFTEIEQKIAKLNGCISEENDIDYKQKNHEIIVNRSSIDNNSSTITYNESFSKLGGKIELQKHAEVSKTLLDKVTNPELREELFDFIPRDYRKRIGYSTLMVNQKFVTTLDELYKKASHVMPKFERKLQSIAEITKGNLVMGPIKDKIRARAKAQFKYSDPSGVAWHRLTDIIRGTIEYGSMTEMYQGLEKAINIFGADVKEFNDRYQNPTEGGYRDIQLVVFFKDHMCELELNITHFLLAKKQTGQRNFEVLRELKAAVKEGNLSRVVEALNFGIGNNRSDEKTGQKLLRDLLRREGANTLLHEAAKSGFADVLHALLVNGADADVQDINRDTPLHIAVSSGSERCVWALLSASTPNLDAENNDGHTALMKGFIMLWRRPDESAVRAVLNLAQVAGVERIKEARLVVNEHINKLLRPNHALVRCALYGKTEEMIKLLQEFSDPNSCDSAGNSALYVAVLKGNKDVVEVLIQFKASLETGANKEPLVNAAIKSNKRDVLRMLIHEGAEVGKGLLAAAIESGNIEVANILLEGDIPQNDSSAVIAAVKFKQLDMLKLMIDKGSKVNTGVLDYIYTDVIKSGNIELFNTIIRAGIPQSSSSALATAAKFHQIEMLRILLDRGVKAGVDSLQIAVQNSSRKMAQILVEAGAPRNKVLPHVGKIPCGIDGDWKWCGITAVGSIYFCAPYQSRFILAIEGGADTVYTIPCGIDGSYKWRGIAAVGTKLFCAPSNASTILVIDADTRETRHIPCGIDGKYKWDGIVAVGSKLFCAPFNASFVLVIDSVTEKIRTIPCSISGKIKRNQPESSEKEYHKWSGIAAVGTKVFCAPYSSSSVLVIDAETEKIRTLPCGVFGEDKWNGIAAVKNLLFCSPRHASSVLVIDSVTEIVSTIALDDICANPRKLYKWYGITAVGGKLFCAPRDESNILVIDSISKEMSLLPCNIGGDDKFLGIASSNNKIYCAPSNSPSILIMEDKLTTWGFDTQK